MKTLLVFKKIFKFLKFKRSCLQIYFKKLEKLEQFQFTDRQPSTNKTDLNLLLVLQKDNS